MHIPKTGGISLKSLLEHKFKTQEICPYTHLYSNHSYYSLPCIKELSNELIEELRKYQLFTGHLGWLPRTFLAASEVDTITFFRDPVDRTISFYNYLHTQDLRWADVKRRWPTFEDFIYDPQLERKQLYFNPHVAFFCADYCLQTAINNPPPYHELAIPTHTGWMDADLDSAQFLELAKNRLHECAFVGMTDRYQESIEMLCSQYSWPIPQRTPHKKVSPKLVQRSNLSAKTLDRIMGLTQLDHALYEEALNFFEDKRRNRIVLSQADIEKEMAQNLPLAEEINFTFNERFLGDGWDSREVHNSSSFCWNLATKSTLYFSIAAVDNLYLSFHVLYTVIPDLHVNLSLKVNSQKITLSHYPHPEGGFIFEGIIPNSALSQTSSLVELEFLLPKVIRPIDMNQGSSDTRELGFACKEVIIKQANELKT